MPKFSLCICSFLEIPACEQWGICSQNCMQLKHKHKCFCQPGYIIEPDHYTCKSTGEF